MALRFEFIFRIRHSGFGRIHDATSVVIVFSPPTFERFRRESQNHNNVYADDGFNDAKVRPIAYKHQINFIIKIIVII